jgi:sugar fermentation stimulation protein A
MRAGEVAGVPFSRPLVAGRFLRRLNRFAALVEVEGGRERVHVRNSGRLRELFTPGRLVLLEPAVHADRRTRFTLALVRLSSGYVSADAHLPNALVADALHRRAIPGLRGYRILRREPAMGRNRADFLLGRGTRQRLLEVKSVTLVEQGVALFPDAPTLRGRTHLEHLIAARRRGLGAAILFVIQRSDATALAPNWDADAAFGEMLRCASRVGVHVGALVCRVNPRRVQLGPPVPVRLGRPRLPPAVRERG